MTLHKPRPITQPRPSRLRKAESPTKISMKPQAGRQTCHPTTSWVRNQCLSRFPGREQPIEETVMTGFPRASLFPLCPSDNRRKRCHIRAMSQRSATTVQKADPTNRNPCQIHQIPLVVVRQDQTQELEVNAETVSIRPIQKRRTDQQLSRRSIPSPIFPKRR